MISVIKKATFIVLAFVVFTNCESKKEEKVEDTASEVEVKKEEDPLPSWNDGDVKKNIMGYVQDITDSNSPNFVEEQHRIATFDNDGTLWSEKPMYFQVYFMFDRIDEMAKEHPEWKNKQPYKAVLERDMEALKKQGMKGLLELLMTTHSGMTSTEFEDIVSQWITTAKHPEKDKLFTELVYQPMIELIDYLEANDFTVYIVSAGGMDFMRPWTEKAYGLPRNRVIGSTIKTEYDYNNGKPVLKRKAEVDFIDDHAGKPVSIFKYIGQKPIIAGGNSDGDLEMLQWTDSNDFKSLKIYVHHTDSIREWSYDRNSMVGKFDKGLDEATKKNWTIIDMKKDWKVIYPYQLEEK
ncbi:HAD family hydrolase [Galbibacter mesophilus]|uniref:HAD family hydrolase n=1 Tax=Galbibacter mesophilus TaxID=379069 RepID=UPI00191D731D|nr:HAD family hydrolase [Galbibacter mesophilus]MCM5663433.1 haloacid dehalogenase-like hydrolase [Galbibacter mesophilus]